ncbi:MAG: hypothetical protein IIY46_03955 [Lachnospiraceae bacterium]|nr:hypothetical protein [Lachnospiraceae bacterium]
MSVPMAIVDFIPVFLFLVSAVILMRDLYHMMSKGAFALFSAGCIVIFTAGFYKATWKMLYALGICDFVALNRAFFPMQSTGFLLAALGMCALLFFRQKPKEAVLTAAPLVYTSSLVFIIFLALGSLGILGCLARLARKMKQKLAMILFWISFLCMMMMGYLSSKDFTRPILNWMGEIVNTAGMILLLIAVILLHKAGLSRFELARKAE